MKYVPALIACAMFIGFFMWLIWNAFHDPYDNIRAREAKMRLKNTKYLNRKYLQATKKAQRAMKKNKAIGEFWYNESERYKALVEKSTTKEI